MISSHNTSSQDGQDELEIGFGVFWQNWVFSKQYNVIVAHRKKKLEKAVQITQFEKVIKNFTTPLLQFPLSLFRSQTGLCVCVCTSLQKNISNPAIEYVGDKWEGTCRNNVSGTTLRDKDIRHIFPHFDPHSHLLHQKQFTTPRTSSFLTVKKKYLKDFAFLFKKKLLQTEWSYIQPQTKHFASSC